LQSKLFFSHANRPITVQNALKPIYIRRSMQVAKCNVDATTKQKQ